MTMKALVLDKGHSRKLKWGLRNKGKMLLNEEVDQAGTEEDSTGLVFRMSRQEARDMVKLSRYFVFR